MYLDYSYFRQTLSPSIFLQIYQIVCVEQVKCSKQLIFDSPRVILKLEENLKRYITPLSLELCTIESII